MKRDFKIKKRKGSIQKLSDGVFQDREVLLSHGDREDEGIHHGC
jgi:hypothetical protein